MPDAASPVERLRAAIAKLATHWRERADQHEHDSNGFDLEGDDLNYQRQDAFAYAGRLHADKLDAVLALPEWAGLEAPASEDDDVMRRCRVIERKLRSWGVDESAIDYDGEAGRSWLLVHLYDRYVEASGSCVWLENERMADQLFLAAQPPAEDDRARLLEVEKHARAIVNAWRNDDIDVKFDTMNDLLHALGAALTPAAKEGKP